MGRLFGLAQRGDGQHPGAAYDALSPSAVNAYLEHISIAAVSVTKVESMRQRVEPCLGPRHL